MHWRADSNTCGRERKRFNECFAELRLLPRCGRGLQHGSLFQTHFGIRRVHWLAVATLHYVHAQTVTLFHSASRRASVHNRGVEQAHAHVARLRGGTAGVSILSNVSWVEGGRYGTLVRELPAAGISSPSRSNVRGGGGEEGSAMASNASSAADLDCIQESYSSIFASSSILPLTSTDHCCHW
jgi:hypothetical protein